MIYNFKNTYSIEVSGEIEADSESEALAIAEKIYANITSDNGIKFDIPGAADYIEIETDDLPDIEIDADGDD